MGALNGWSGRTTGKMVDRIIRKQGDAPAPVAPSPTEAISANGSANGDGSRIPVRAAGT